jgi:pimeloyl-ACP methyl ester carboxylesterase
MHTLYFIPGLGADERLFSKLTLTGYKKKYIKWVVPKRDESLPQYAKRLSSQIDTSKPFSLIGVSFGGMLAVEMSKFLKLKKVILIASAKTNKELPASIHPFRYFPLYNYLPESMLQSAAVFNEKQFGIKNKEDGKLFSDMLLACPKGYLQGAMQMILEWRNTTYPKNLIHIHGGKDRFFPIYKIKNPVVIQDGTHFMPYHSAKEVEKIIVRELKK